MSSTELSELFGPQRVPGESSVPLTLLIVCQGELTESLAELTEFAAELSEFSPPRQCSRNSIPPVSYGVTKSRQTYSMPNMTGRPGYRTMEMNGGSSAPYLACTPYVPSFCTLFNRGGKRGAFRLSGAGGGAFPLYGGTFARSFLVSTYARKLSGTYFSY